MQPTDAFTRAEHEKKVRDFISKYNAAVNAKTARLRLMKERNELYLADRKEEELEDDIDELRVRELQFPAPPLSPSPARR